MTIIRISQAGGCPRRIALEARGVQGLPISPATQRAFDEGNLHESSILEWLANNVPGAKSQYTIMATQVEVTIPGTPIVGHVDAELWPESRSKEPIILAEAKCLAARSFQELRSKGVKESHPQYYTQVQLYRHCYEVAANLPHPFRSIIVARNKETPPTRTWDHHYEEVVYDPEFCKREVDRLCALAESIDRGDEIPIPEGYSPETDWHCKPRWCPYTYVCHPNYQRKRVEALQRDELYEAVEQYQALSEQIAELTAAREELKQRLLASIGEGPVRAGIYLLTVQERRTERFDTKAARKTLPPELLARLLTVTTSRILRVEEVV